jgi:isopentenyl-diphosphate delta-isomerase
MANNNSATSSRKLDHLKAVLEGRVSFRHVTPGFERYRFEHCALPELDFDAVNLSTSFLGKELRAPLLISPVTGGANAADNLSPELINRRFAETAQELGIALGVGSQRAALESPDLRYTYAVRDVAPDALLMANLGAVQLNYGYGVDECRRVVDMIEADALVLHLNPMQEYFQNDGDLDFSGLLPNIKRVCARLDVPVVVKEVGWGLSAQVSRQLVEAGVAAIDVAGAGGTSWSEVEMTRSNDDGKHAIAQTFADWGIPTTDALVAIRSALPAVPVIASGGVRSGLDVAKAIALGADLAGMASPLLVAVHESIDALHHVLTRTIEELRLAMFGTGSGTLDDLRRPGLLQHP